MRRLIIILGMRSGSSLTAQISRCMGAYLGEDSELLDSSPSNPDGHFEHRTVVQINDRILQLCNREWYSLEAPDPDYDSPYIKREMEEIEGVICRLFEKEDTVAIKDPRICVLLPLWDKILKEQEIEVNYIWVFRNPLEVAESLRKRDGYSSNYGLWLWIHYHLSVLKYLHGKEYLLINYKDILEQSQALEDLSRLFGCTFDDNLKGKLKHIIKQVYCHSDYSYRDVCDTKNKLLSEIYGALVEKREAQADVAEWEKSYRKAMDKGEASFVDYNVLENIRCLEEKEIVIYGAGNYGKRAARMLQQLNFTDYNFCDKDVHKHGIYMMNGKVFSVAEIENRKNLLIIVAIENENIRKEMEQTLAYIEKAAFLSYFALEKAYRYFVSDLSTLFSKAESLSTWYKELNGRANNVKNACKSPILVYQNGKVGSSSVSKSLWKAGIENAHVHRFFFKKDIVGELMLGEEKKEFVCTSNFLNFQFPEYVRAVKEEMKYKKIITMVREPISVDLSTVFQWIGSGTSDRFFEERIRQGKTFRQVVSELMLKIQNRQYEWFDDELKELTGIDVYSYPFNKKEGYTIISEKGIEVLLLKAEELSNLTDVIRDFVNAKQFELINENVGRYKQYAHLYKKIKEEIQFTRDYVEAYYNAHSHINHFYSENEQREFLDKWKRNIVCWSKL